MQVSDDDQAWLYFPSKASRAGVTRAESSLIALRNESLAEEEDDAEEGEEFPNLANQPPYPRPLSSSS
ncbi:hypothetical protein Q1695_005771 [Nippostrongylus brasiliensis]|nr:hypothetical protein Q1695_005771 [Nippostrongylus brasiliensis]